MAIPLVDISGFDDGDADRKFATVARWRNALDTLGFVTIRGHDIPEALTADLHRQACAFFEQPLAIKLQHAAKDPTRRGTLGYIPPMGESVGRTSGGSGAPDLVESLSFSDAGGDAGTGATPSSRWPGLPDDLAMSIGAYADAAYALGKRLMRLSAAALGLAEDYFDELYSPMQNKLRLAYYPEQDVTPEAGQLRNAPHTDFAGFTILLQDSAPGGLQVLMPDGQWIDVPSVPGTLVINTGDLLQRWTNDRWMSNVHRVVNPPAERRGSSRRLSIVFFTGPRDAAEIVCLPGCASPGMPAHYPPITAGEHIRAKVQQTYGA